MLQLQKIRKVYVTGSESVEALKGISLSFRKQEFVSVLGPSGCGKTTLLNIIGGLDQYTSGDLSINGRSTREYKDRDWDTYRNHSIGFVFQSYNLIPHQSVLANVELALTISGVSRKERRRRAADALRRVGLGNQLHKKPNQMSGGQMQRVAIARAIVNNPEILLADEPTGALDSTTSVQIMNLLSEIARDRLVIMVTHNPDLARTYSSRIIYMQDGLVTKDTRPFDPRYPEEASDADLKKKAHSAVDTYLRSYRETSPKKLSKEASEKGKKKKASMSFWTALSLSLKNLLTKKTRTMLTAFAGSIGIIGIALIQSVSSGVQFYIDRVQEDTLSSYPITIQRENADMTALLESLMQVGSEGGEHRDEDRVYANSVLFEMMNSLTQIEVEENNLSKFKDFLESDSEIKKYISAVHYSYGSGIQFYTKDDNGEIYKADINEMMSSFMGGSSGSGSSGMGGSMGSMGMMGGSLSVFEEILPGEGDEPVHELVKEQYDLIYGDWPAAYNEVLLIVDENNSISDLSLYALGLKSADEFETAMKNFYLGKETVTDEKSWSFEEICARTYRMVLDVNRYTAGDGKFTDLSESEIGRELLYNNGTEIRVTGIIRKNPDALSAMLNGSIAYTSMLTDHMIEQTLASELIQAQLENPTVDALTGLPFETESAGDPTAEEIRSAVLSYIEAATLQKRAAMYRALASQLSGAERSAITAQVNAIFTDKNTAIGFLASSGMLPSEYMTQLEAMPLEQMKAILAPTVEKAMVEKAENEKQAAAALLSDADAAAALDAAASDFTESDCALLYENYVSLVSDNTYTGVLEMLGYVDADFPSSILIYAKTFEDKDQIASAIARYNSGVSEEDVIEYTDYVALLMSSISTVIQAISYVLIAFVAISLVVSSIMISIITYISVLERTKEIGVLRAIGASKRDVSRVFNAETLIEGFVSGALGIAVTLLLLIPINLILHAVTGIETLSAVLPVGYAVGLVIISMLLTVVAGIIPSGMAAKRDPVAALRAE